MKETDINEQVSILALSKVQGLKPATLCRMLDIAGSANNIFLNIADIHNIFPGIKPELVAALSDSSIFDAAKKEMDFIQSKGIHLYCINDKDYPYRLRECEDAPIAIYTLGNVPLNAEHIISVVGTRHATEYGKDICNAFISDLARMLPGTLIVSGLAYGIDVCAHRAALACGLPTVGVLAHGLDRIYPVSHRNTAKEMLSNGGLLTEFMSGTNSLPAYFVQRNRIVAGIADATVVVESAASGGSLITASLAQSYSRDCFAFPGRVNDKYSIGCNELVARNKAALITSAYDFVEAMNWNTAQSKKAITEEPELFPELSDDEQRIIQLLSCNADGLQVNRIVIELNMPVNIVMSLLFELEMKNLVRSVAGGSYRAVFSQ